VYVYMCVCVYVCTLMVQFWRKKKSMEGMSIRSLGVNCFFQVQSRNSNYSVPVLLWVCELWRMRMNVATSYKSVKS
jgi:hypothetical protein